MSLEFHGIAVNEQIHPSADVVRELEKRTLYRVDEILNLEQLDSVEWVISYNLGQTLNIESTHGIRWIDPNGIIFNSTPGHRSYSTPPVYIIPYEDSPVPPWCVAVEKIERAV